LQLVCVPLTSAGCDFEPTECCPQHIDWCVENETLKSPLADRAIGC
jgi:hypothetical protein